MLSAYSLPIDCFGSFSWNDGRIYEGQWMQALQAGEGGSPKRLCKAPTDNTKPRQTPSLDRLYKASADYTKTHNMIQGLRMLDKTFKILNKTFKILDKYLTY